MSNEDKIEQLQECLHALLPGLKQLVEAKYIQTFHICAKCKSSVQGCRNGDLYCETCKTWSDPDEDTERHRLIQKHQYTDWADSAIKMIENLE